MSAAAVRASAQRVMRETLARLGPSERTMGAKLLASQVVERCARSAEAHDWYALTVWSREACARYGGAVPAQRVITEALERLATAFDRDTGEADALGYERARTEIASALANRPPQARAGTLDAVDEADVALDTLLHRLDRIDPLTAEHSRAVGAWCARLAKHFGDSKDAIAHAARAGLVHDIGKISTPLEILIAPRGLSDDEMETMRRHTLDGETMVREIPLLVKLARVVRSHHERFDGKGYPDGLRWEAIPRDARIVAVADAFNAMIGRRPYRAPLAPSAALDELARMRGTQFDPDVVDAMSALLAERA
ncbi:MAG TPA: HD domain-containing phosphohydrolase [Candidatus Elarobacter sp.]|jgi:putative nucleotidyltransferase with HDIG domain|nr:HD domain-containing phosphohydrolase [Candidatus Elarobacter sp.]